jgi:uncharacterized protein YecE (DUF72 family)
MRRSPTDGYFLGLPAWAFPGWKDRYFPDDPDRLANYAAVFNTVEGNTTFYGIPDQGTVSRWRDSVAGSTLRFCFKLPREVTHERKPDLSVLERFLAVIEMLDTHLGPLLVQFPASVGPDRISTFEPVLDALAGRHAFAVEVRDRAFFLDPARLTPLLEQYNASRVTLDSRPIYEGDRAHPEVLSALHEKPDVPVLPDVIGDVAFVRLILHPDLASNRRYLDEWAANVAAYLRDGIQTFMMIHCPNNLHCPPLAMDFHEALRAAAPGLALPPLSPWPVPEQMQLV